VNGEHQDIVVAIRLHRASQQQRLGAAEAAFRCAIRTGIDELRLQPAFIDTPPANIAEAVSGWIKRGRRHRGWLILERPSGEDINIALSASPFLESVSLVTRRRAIVSLADAADTLTLEIPRAEWNALRGKLEEAVGGPLDYEVAELATSD
jgi:hypothetical protein